MTDPTSSTGKDTSASTGTHIDEQQIRERVRELTAQLLSGGRLDTERVKEVVRTVSGGAARPSIEGDRAREAFAEALRGLDAALHASSMAAHTALQALVTRGKDFSDNDLKNAFASLQNLQKDYVAVANRIAEATTGNLRSELSELALHAQRVGADVNVRFAQTMSEFANRIGTFSADAMPGFDSVRQYGANMTLLSSGLLAGVADALRQASEVKKAK